MIGRVSRVLLVAAIAVNIASCASEPEPRRPAAGGLGATPVPAAGVVLQPTTFSALPDWMRDRQGEAFPALLRSCSRIERRAVDQPLGGDRRLGSIGEWQQICAAARRFTPDDRFARRFFEEWFQPYAVFSDGTDQGLFTGYYEPLLRGSWQRKGPYQIPLHRPPVKGPKGSPSEIGLPNRAQIAAGALRGQGLELLWVDDPIDAFFLEIQGSGRVQLDTGQVVRVGFAGKNGHSYFPVGRELIRRGEVAQEDMSMQAIRDWMKRHPDQAPGLMALNPSYVFFRLIDGDGPIGAQGVALTPARSLAVDPSFVPYGVPVWLDTTDPLKPSSPIRRLLIAQDTGGAIKGAIRGDVFWGGGAEAESRAGMMKQAGRWYLLLPKAAAAR